MHDITSKFNTNEDLVMDKGHSIFRVILFYSEF